MKSTSKIQEVVLSATPPQSLKHRLAAHGRGDSMSPAADVGSHMFMPQPQAGSGLRMPAEQRWTPGCAAVIAMPIGIPPGSGATLSERDRRLEARRDERRRRSSHGHQEGPAEKVFREREKDRQTFERETAARKQPAHVKTRGSASNEAGNPAVVQISSNALAATPFSAGGSSLTSALDQQVADKSDREAKYERKRLQYIAAKRGSKSDEPIVHFQGKPSRKTSIVAGRSPASVAAALLQKEHEGPAQQQSIERVPSPKPQSQGESQWAQGTHQSSLRSHDSVHSPVPRSRPRAQRILQLEEGPVPLPKDNENAHFPKRDREQMVADAMIVQLAKDNEHRSAHDVAPTPAEQGSGFMHTSAVGKGGTESSVPASVDRKAEYACQLREQMAADEATKKAAENERKNLSTITSSTGATRGGVDGSGARGDGSEWMVGGPGRDAKAEYAQQLREQMAAKENEKRAAKEKMQRSLSANAGPRWIEGATEGREARRKRSNTEYAEQLRAQIAAQKDLTRAQQSRIASRAQAPRPSFLDAGLNDEDQQQQLHPQPQWGVDVGHRILRNTGPERLQAGHDQGHGGQDRREKEHSEGLVDAGWKVPASKRGADNTLALERQKRLDNQREYAEALRRDMATPKVDSLGRPIEDITSPSRTRFRNAHNQSRYTTTDGVLSRGGGEIGVTGEGRGSLSHQRYHVDGDMGQQIDRGRRPPAQGGEYRGDQRSQTAAWPPSQDRAWYAGEQPQQRQRLPFPETHRMAHGEGANEHHSGSGYDERRRPENGQRGVRWVDDVGGVHGLPPPQGPYANGGREQSWGTSGPSTLGGGYPDRASGCWSYPGQQQDDGAQNLLARGAPDGTWRGEGGWNGNGGIHPGLPWEARGQQQYRHSGPGGTPGGAPAVGVAVVSTKASTMHNPVDPDELARIQAKKESYRRDLEAQMAAHKRILDQRKRGAPGTKEAEVFHLQEAMEERNERNKMAPGYEMGPLGVAVMKDNYSSTGRGKRSPPRMRAQAPAAPVAADVKGYPAGGKPSALPAEGGLFGKRGDEDSSSSLLSAECGARGADTEGSGVLPRRGSGLRNLLGMEASAERDRERSRTQAEALKKQVEDNKTRRDSERAQRELEDRKEELRLQKEREQLHKRYEQEGKLAKALESEQLLKEAEEARLAHAARKEKAAAESREAEKREDARVEREQKELESKYAKERAVEEPLGHASSDPAMSRELEFPAERAAVGNSPRTKGTPREVKARFAGVQSIPGEAMPVPAMGPTNNPPESSVKGDISPRQYSAKGDTPREGPSVEKLRMELWKQRQLTEVLRREVGQQETEKRKLLDIARYAKESEAAALRAMYERRASQQALSRELSNTGSVVGGTEMWRVPPPPDMQGIKSESGMLKPGGRRPEHSAHDAPEMHAEKGTNYMLDSNGTTEDRLLLVGLRSLSDPSRKPGEGRDSATPRKDNLGGDSTFRERLPGARAWSSGGVSDSGNGGSIRDLPLRYDQVSPSGIRAKSRYVFPDGSVRQRLESPDAGCTLANGADGGVPMPLVGTSRSASADLSLATGIEALGDGGGGDAEDTVKTSGRHRGIDTQGSRGSKAGAYRGPGAAPGAAWAPGGRPPRAYVPFLNLPSSNSKKHAKSSEERRRRGSSSNDSVNGGADPLSFLPSVHSAGGGRWGKIRGRPLAGVGGVPVSPGRAMLTGPGRPGTETSLYSPTIRGDKDSESSLRRGSRRRLGGRSGGGNQKMAFEEDSSDGGDSIGSGSTDVEFLRRRAEAKLRSLNRLEAAGQARDEELDSLVTSSSARNASGEGEAESGAKPARTLETIGTVAPTHSSNPRRTFSGGSGSSSRSLMYSSRNKRPGTNYSEGSMTGDSRWAVAG